MDLSSNGFFVVPGLISDVNFQANVRDSTFACTSKFEIMDDSNPGFIISYEFL